MLHKRLYHGLQRMILDALRGIRDSGRNILALFAGDDTRESYRR